MLEHRSLNPRTYPHRGRLNKSCRIVVPPSRSAIVFVAWRDALDRGAAISSFRLHWREKWMQIASLCYLLPAVSPKAG